MSDEQNFLSRWARRKSEHRQENTSAEEQLKKPTPALPVISPATLPVEPPCPDGVSEAPVPPAVPAPSMEDVASLTKDSNFAPFVAKNATQLVKNAALKKLFSDPHFNIMDRLDIYIDDYSQPDPLPDGWLDKLEHAKGWLTPTDAQRDAAKRLAAQAGAVTPEATTPQEMDNFEVVPEHGCDTDPLFGSEPSSKA